MPDLCNRMRFLLGSEQFAKVTLPLRCVAEATGVCIAAAHPNLRHSSCYRTKIDVEDLLQQLTGWHSSLSGVSEGFGEGCLYVDTAPLKGLVMPAVSRAIDALKAHTVVLARSACSESLSDIRARIPRLFIRSQEVDGLNSLQVCSGTQPFSTPTRSLQAAAP